MADVWSRRYGPHDKYYVTEKEFQDTADRLIAAIKLQEAPMLRCKMRVSEVIHIKDAEGKTTQERVKLTAVYGPSGTENGKWSQYTPAANFDISISNPEAFNKLASGHEFFVDFTPSV